MATLRTANAVTIDLVDSEDEDIPSPPARPATAPTAPPAVQTATAAPPPPAAPKSLSNLAPLHQRYLVKYSTMDDVLLQDPGQFSIKPPYFNRWSAEDYVKMAECLRFQFDPKPVARMTGKPVEEVLHMFNIAVVNPLYFPEEICPRGDNGMINLMELFKKHGTPMRPWMDGKVKGELDQIEKQGWVKIILQDGSVKELELKDLSTADLKYLKTTLSKKDRELLSGRKSAKDAQKPEGDRPGNDENGSKEMGNDNDNEDDIDVQM